MPKIIYAETSSKLYFSFDSKKYFIDKTCFMITGELITYLHTFLSSSIIKFFLKISLPKLGSEGSGVGKFYLEKIKIPRDLNIIEKIESMSNRVSNSNETNSSITFDKIDFIVCNMYSLSNSELKYLSEITDSNFS